MKKMSIFTDCKFMDRIRQMDFSRYNPETEEQIRKAIHCQEYKEEIFGKE